MLTPQEVRRAVCDGLGSVIGHQEIHADRPELFRQDGVHLSDWKYFWLTSGGAAFGAREAWWRAWALSVAYPLPWR